MRNEVYSLKYHTHLSNIKHLNSCLTENVPHLYANYSVTAIWGKLNIVRITQKHKFTCSHGAVEASILVSM